MCNAYSRKISQSYNNLYNNLKTIIIRYPTEEESKRLASINVDCSYNFQKNELLISKEASKSENYRYIIVNELLHVSSFDEEHFGFKLSDSITGTSLNEGMTEFLTMQVFKDISKCMKIYINDLNNILLMSTIIPLEKLVNMYFYDGFTSLHKEYIDIIGLDNNFGMLIDFMDQDHIERVKNNNFNNQYKDNYIIHFLQDIKKLKFDSLDTTTNVITIFINFIKSQYPNKNIPINVKNELESTISLLLSNFSNRKD